MYQRLKKDIERAGEHIKWFASLLSERIRIEIAVFKLMYRSEEIKKRKEELLRVIGAEVYSSRESASDVYSNSEIRNAIIELESLDPQINEIAEKVQEISKAVS
ncbi:MAG: hypothetical protein RBT37_04765 [Dissulfurispiraceae bacterium]|jgi:hypothetical protein|nr:hypothetical protein [Dissulfurispiraceae bacterium]